MRDSRERDDRDGLLGIDGQPTLGGCAMPAMRTAPIARWHPGQEGRWMRSVRKQGVDGRLACDARIRDAGRSALKSTELQGWNYPDAPRSDHNPSAQTKGFCPEEEANPSAPQRASGRGRHLE